MNALQTYDLLQPIVASLNKRFVASSVNALAGNEYRLFTCNTLWLTPGRTLTIGTDKFTITDILPNTWVKLKGLVAPPLTFDIYPPFFYHGTVLAQNSLLNLPGLADSEKKFPMIWLQEVTKEIWQNDYNTIIERKSECNIYFLVDSKLEWLTRSPDGSPDHDRYAVIPMRNLVAEFVKSIDQSTFINLNDMQMETGDHANFGKYLSDKGHIIGVFSDDLSGVQMRCTIPFQKQKDCKKVCS